MYRYYFLLFAFVLLGCPSVPPEDDTTEPNDQATPWDPTAYFETMETPPAELLEPDPLPELEGDYTLVTAKQFKEDPDILNTLDAPRIMLVGDFTEFGRIKLNRLNSNTRTVLSGLTDPFQARDKNECTKVDALDIQGGSWVITKIWFNSESQEKFGVKYTQSSRMVNVENCTWSRCRWTNAVNGIRVVNSSYNTFQYLAANERALVPIDGALVGFEAPAGQESRGNRVLYCETVDLPDGIGGAPWSISAQQAGSTPGTVFAFNAGQKTPAIYRPVEIVIDGDTLEYCAYMAEDGVDIKNGAREDGPGNRSWFYANFHTGSRPTGIDCKDGASPCASAGSSGVGIGVWHNWAKFWNIWGNLSLDDIHGLYVEGYLDNDERTRVEGIDVRYNVVAYQADCNPGGYPKPGSDRPPRPNENNGLALRVVCPDCTVENNVVAGTNTAYYKPTLAKYSNNLFAEITPGTARPEFTPMEALTWKEYSVQVSPLLNPDSLLTILLPVPNF
jgi:hypothetical protein